MSLFFQCIFYVFSAFTLSIPKPFAIKYNPYTQSIDTIDKPHQVVQIVRDLKNQILGLEDAMKKMETKSKQ